MSADQQLEAILNSVLKEVCMRGDFIHAEALKPAGNTCMVQGGACYSANCNAADFHKASLNFHYPQFACMPGRVWKTQQTEWHQDVSSLPHPIFVRAELAKVTGLKACFAIPLSRQGHVVAVVVFYSRQVIPYDEALEETVFNLANEMLQDICQRFGQTELEFVSKPKSPLSRRARTGVSKVWESAKTSLDVDPKCRSEADVENIIKFSKRIPFFKYVSTTAREALCRSMQHIVLQEGEVAIKGPKDQDFVWFIVVKGRCDMMLRTEHTGKHYPMRAFEEGDTFAHSYLCMLTGESNAIKEGDIRAREPNTSVVRVYVEPEHRADFRSQTKPLLYEELAKYFNMAADQAAERLGLCMSAIKKVCRRHGIIRWPHRKLLSANKSLALIDSKMMEADHTPQSQSILRDEAITVLVSKLRVMLNPTYLVNSEFVQVQPSAGSGQQVAGRHDMFELEGSLSPNSDALDADDVDSDLDTGHAATAKRKKAPEPKKSAIKQPKEKKAKGGDAAQKKTAQGHQAPAHAGTSGSLRISCAAHADEIVWKQEGVGEKGDNGMLAPLAGAFQVRHNGKALPSMASISTAASASHSQERAPAFQNDNGASAPGELSIEYLSNMVRASLEKVPANLRDQVLSSVMTGSKTHVHQAPTSHALPTQRAHAQAMLPDMVQGPYAYMQMPGIMQQAHDHHAHQHIYAHHHQQMAAKQSVHGLLHPRTHNINGAAAHGAAPASNQAARPYADAPAGLNAAAHNDESSDEEDASAASTWSHIAAHSHGQSLREMPGARNPSWPGQLEAILRLPAGAGSHLPPYGMGGRGRMPQLAPPNQEVEWYGASHRPVPPLSLMSSLTASNAATLSAAPAQQDPTKDLPSINASKAATDGNHVLIGGNAGKGVELGQQHGSMELLGLLSAPDPNTVVGARGSSEGGTRQSGGGEAGGQQGQGQGGLWANIHLLCDLLGGPLGHVGQLTESSHAHSSHDARAVSDANSNRDLNKT